MFKDRVLRRICGLKMDEVTGGWQKLLKDEFIICTLQEILV
jgi:hypothetical protein